MLYCFVKEDLDLLPPDDPLMLQAQYASQLGAYCVCSIESGTLTIQNTQRGHLLNEKVFLRATYNNMLPAMALLESRNIPLVETASDVDKLEHWETLGIAKRKIVAILGKELCNENFDPVIRELLQETDMIFLKTRQKGFSCGVASSKVRNHAPEILEFLERRGALEEELLLSPLLTVRRDSLGSKEARFFVLDGVIKNTSRVLHTLRHAVPKSLRIKAEEIVDVISKKTGFPQNYVLDIGEFESGAQRFSDIVEINPITASLCYVNNSIFEKVLPDVVPFQEKLLMGAEYCLDAMQHPERYHVEREPGRCYEYFNPERYDFFEDTSDEKK